MTRVIISGGGTGGHIFPAIAIANALKKRMNDIEILFIGAKGRMEMTKVPAAGYPIEGLNISGFQRQLTWKNLAFPFRLLGSMMKARSIIRKFKPDAVIGVGGYASGPTLRNATSMGIPTLIQEQNSFPGVTNRILAGRVGKICVAYEGMEKYFPAGKIIFTGNPIRQDLLDLSGKQDEALRHFGLLPGLKTVLVIGGSLGAGTINRAMLKFIMQSHDRKDLQVLWQTGKNYHDSVVLEMRGGESTEPESGKQNATSERRNAGFKTGNTVILPFIDRMDLAYSVADIIVSRAGAIAISELCVVGKPVILIPSPNVAEDHQTKNARALSDRAAAIMIADRDAMEKLGGAITGLLSDASLQKTLTANIRQLGITNAADRIAAETLALTGMTGGVDPGSGPRQGKSGMQDIKYDVRNPESVYLLGIGGIGMSSLARYFASRGASVSGYDKTPTPLTDELIAGGMNIHFVDDVEQLPRNPGLVIYTPAIPADHREFNALKQRGVPMKKRAEVLGMISGEYKTIAVAGTHGKTTTSTLIAHILKTAGSEMLAFLGGISKNHGTNFLCTAGATDPSGAAVKEVFCVVEADEYDRSFLHLAPHLAIITSADADHLDIYGNAEDMRRSFGEFTSKILPGGALIMKHGVRVEPVNTNGFSVYGYSVKGPGSYYAENITICDGLHHFDLVTPSGVIPNLVPGVPGHFNLENAIAAAAAAHLLGIGEGHIRSALESYSGVSRRFDYRIRRPDRIYIDDYAHHPEELRACISAVRELYPGRRITGVFQPHLYSRTRDLADDFARSLEMLDELILLDIYPAREKPIEGITSRILLDRVSLPVKKLVSKEHLLDEIKELNPGVLLTLGAGDIDQFTEPLANMLNEMTP